MIHPSLPLNRLHATSIKSLILFIAFCTPLLVSNSHTAVAQSKKYNEIVVVLKERHSVTLKDHGPGAKAFDIQPLDSLNRSFGVRSIHGTLNKKSYLFGRMFTVQFGDSLDLDMVLSKYRRLDIVDDVFSNEPIPVAGITPRSLLKNSAGVLSTG